MLSQDREILQRVEKALGVNCPSPESELSVLSKIASQFPNTEKGAKMRRFVIDIDDLVAQTRWHLGQALYLMETYPHVLTQANPEADDSLTIVSKYGAPANALLLLRGYVRDADRIFFEDLAIARRGGTVAGWIFHMMIDNAIYRSTATLDRIAHLLWYEIELPLQESGKEVRIYFRKGTLEKVYKKWKSPHVKSLLNLCEDPAFKYIISYRNKYTHTEKVYSSIAGTRPADEWTGPDGKHYIRAPLEIDAETLFALANASYHQLTASIKSLTESLASRYNGNPIP